jgi:hypothetical protein
LPADDDPDDDAGENEPPESVQTPPEPTPESSALPPDLQRALTWF